MPATDYRTLYAWATLIVVAGLLAYGNSLSNPFIFDDKRAVLENQQIRALWPPSVPLSPPDESPVARRPLVNLSFAVNYAVGGLDVSGYRIANLAIHLLTALALFGLVRRTLGLSALAPRFGVHAMPIAAVAALLWSLHPLHTEVINYISQRTTAMMGLFYVLTLYSSVRGLAPHARLWRAAAVLSCAAGMACKESMVTAPVLVMLFDRVFLFPSTGEMLRRRGGFYSGLASTWVILAALMASGGRTTVGFDAGTSAWVYLLNQVTVLVDYLQLTAWPRGLVVDYGMPRPLAIGDVLWAAMIVTPLGVAALVALRYRPHAGFLASSFFVTLAPTSSFVPIVTEVGAERRMYLPLAALMVLAVCGAYVAGRAVLAWARTGHASNTGAPTMRVGGWIVLTGAACVGMLLATGVVLRNREYQSPLTLAQTLVERRPHGRAYYALAHALFESGRRTDALAYFRRSAVDFPAARFAIGTEMLAEGHLEDGIVELRAFVDALPEHAAVASARQMVATALAAQGKRDAAIAELRRAIAIEPGGPDAARAHGLLGELLLEGQEAADAIPHLERAAAGQPQDAATMRALARALAITGDITRTIAVLTHAVARHPRDVQARDLLGTALARTGRLREALVQFRAAADLDPTYARARTNLAAAERMLARRP